MREPPSPQDAKYDDCDASVRILLLLCLHAKHTACSTSSLSPCRLSLHLLRDFDIDFEEFCNTSIQTNTLTLIEITLSVVGRYTFLQAGLC